MSPTDNKLDNKIECSLDGEARLQLAQLAYRAWAEAFDLMKQVKAEKPDARDPDWAEFHEIRIKNHTKTLESTKRVLDQIAPYSPLVRGD